MSDSVVSKIKRPENNYIFCLLCITLTMAFFVSMGSLVPQVGCQCDKKTEDRNTASNVSHDVVCLDY